MTDPLINALPAPPAVVPVGTICGRPVLDAAGEKLGAITEIMVDTALGMIVYAVLTRGGLLGVGERLYALPFDRLTIDAANGELHSDLAGQDLDALPGFNKDAWPTGPDPALQRVPTALAT